MRVTTSSISYYNSSVPFLRRGKTSCDNADANCSRSIVTAAKVSSNRGAGNSNCARRRSCFADGAADFARATGAGD